MTILDNGTRNQYTASGGQTVFIYDFEIFESGDIRVYRNATLLSLGADYTLTGVGNDNGGTVVLTTGATAGHVYTIFRQVTPERATDYQQSGQFLAQELNDDFDRLWAVIQELETAQSRFLQTSEITQVPLPVTLEDSVTGQYLRWKDTNTIESVAATTLPDGAFVATDYSIRVTDYAALIALDPDGLANGQVVHITDAGIAGAGNIRKVVGHGFASVSGDIVRIDNDTYWERSISDRKAIINSLEDLYTGSSLLNTVETASFYSGWELTTAGPRGGAKFHRGASGGTQTTALTLFTHLSSGYVIDANGNFWHLSSQPLDVYMFGVVGDGVADDTDAIDAAIAYLSAGQEITFSDGVFLVGAITKNGVSRMTFKGSNAQVNLTGTWNFTSCTFLTMIGMKVEESGLGRTITGISLDNNSAGFHYTHGTLGGFNIGISGDGLYKARISENNISGNNTGIDLDNAASTTSNNTIEGNIFGTHYTACIRTDSANSQINDNSFESVQPMVADIVGTSSAKNVTVSGNTFFMSSGVSLSGSVCAVTGNTFNESSNSTANRVVQLLGSGNTFNANTIQLVTAADDVGLYATGEVTGTGNYFKRCFVGVDYAATGGLTWVGNHIVSSTGVSSVGVRLQNATGAIVSNNHFAALGSFSIQEVSSVSNGIYEGNLHIAVNSGAFPYSILGSGNANSTINLIYDAGSAAAPTANAGNGSIYRDKRGGAGTTFYVREGGAWVAK